MIPSGEVVHTYTSDESEIQAPMVVLINENTYSAAELFAADLSEYGAAKLFGQQTSGKGFYQYVFQFADGSAAGISVGRYYTGHGWRESA